MFAEQYPWQKINLVNLARAEISCQSQNKLLSPPKSSPSSTHLLQDQSVATKTKTNKQKSKIKQKKTKSQNKQWKKLFNLPCEVPCEYVTKSWKKLSLFKEITIRRGACIRMITAGSMNIWIGQCTPAIRGLVNVFSFAVNVSTTKCYYTCTQ